MNFLESHSYIWTVLQNVNKVNTKAVVKCSLDSPWIPRWAKADLIKSVSSSTVATIIFDEIILSVTMLPHHIVFKLRRL